jgi:hypothetical protein
MMKTVRYILNSSITCSDHSTVNADEGESNDSDMESQDEGDLGYGARPGGGFTSVVSIQPHTDNKLKYILDKLKGYCTAQPVSGPEETVSL